MGLIAGNWKEIYFYTSAPRKIVNENSTAQRMKLTGTEGNPDAGLVCID